MEVLTQTKSSSSKRILEGVVVSDKMEKTVVVLVERVFRHAKYGKIVRKTKRYKAHDETSSCKEGYVVRICETRPYSKTKYMVVCDILRK